MKVLLAGLMGGSNGIEVYTRRLACSLARRGHEVVVADRSPENQRRELEDPDVAVVPTARKNWKLRRVAGPFESVRAHSDIRDLATTMRADVLHVTYPELVPRAGVPVVVTAWHPVTGIRDRARTRREREQGSAWSEALYAAADRRAFKRASALVPISPAVAEAISASGLEATVVPPFIEDSLIRPRERRESSDCIFVARYLDDPRKGLDLAIAAVSAVRRTHPDVRLVLVGERTTRASEQLPAFCDLRGLLPPEDVSRAMSAAGCCLMPSLWEEFGYVALEALAAGLPVVCPPLSGITALDTNGIFATEREAEALAEGVRAALDSPDEVRFPAEATASHAVSRLTELYNSLIQR